MLQAARAERIGFVTSTALKKCENTIRTLHQRIRPASDIRRVDRLGSKIRNIRAARKLQMAFTGPKADLSDPLDQRGIFGRFAVSVSRQDSLFVEQTVQGLADHRPGVALVFGIFVNDGQRAAIVALSQFQ